MPTYRMTVHVPMDVEARDEEHAARIAERLRGAWIRRGTMGGRNTWVGAPDLVRRFDLHSIEFGDPTEV